MSYFIIDSETLHSVLTLYRPIAEKGSSMLNSVLVKVRQNSVYFLATNQSMVVFSAINLPAQTDGEFDVMIPLDKISPIVALFKGDVKITYDNTKNGVVVTNGKNQSKIACYDASSFVERAIKTDPETTITLPLSSLKKHSVLVSHASANGDYGIHYNIDSSLNQITSVGTDGFRLALFTSECETSETVDFTLTNHFDAALNIFESFGIKNVDVSVFENYIELSSGSVVVQVSRNIDAFPDYTKFTNIPQQLFDVDYDKFVDTLRFIRASTKENVVIENDGNETLVVKATDGTHGDTISRIDATCYDDFSFMLNTGYVYEQISKLSEYKKLTVSQQDKSSMVYFTPCGESTPIGIIAPMSRKG